MPRWAKGIAGGLLFATGVSGQQVDPLDDEFSQLDQQLEQAFIQQDQELERRYLQVQAAIQRAYSNLEQRITVDWQEDVRLPSADTWVTYSDDYQSRVAVNFATGTYQVETLVAESTATSLLKLKQFAQQILQSSPAQLRRQDKLFQQVNLQLASIGEQLSQPLDIRGPSITTSHIDLSPMLPATAVTQIERANITLPDEPNALPAAPVTRVAKRTTLADKPVNSNKRGAQLTSRKQEAKSPVVSLPKRSDESKKVLPSAPEKSVSTPLPMISQQPAADGRDKLVLRMPFINHYQRTLIEQQLPLVESLAQRYQLPVSLILAVIETESSFNPMATSPIPAFGLMQLVPKTAGIDAHNYVYGEPKLLSPEYLYDQENNLKLGTAYLHLLSNRYLGKIKSEQSRLYCTLASYNTGIGNLAKTLVNRKNVAAAINKANQLNSEQLLSLLLTRLPAEETRQYLHKVLARQQQYQHFDQG